MELLDIVDENGIPTGETIERAEAHSRGIRHRTSHVWLLRKRGEKYQVLLQKRSPDKDSYPGCYDISSAGHIPAGCGFIESALRELQEELGIESTEDALFYCGQRHIEFREVFHGRLFQDSQISNIYVLWCDLELNEFNLQKSEIESVVWMDWDVCMDMVTGNKEPHCIVLEELKMVSSAMTGN